MSEEKKKYSMIQILKQNKLNFIILALWFYLGTIMDFTASTLGFLTIGIEHEGNPIIVDAWNSNNYFLFLIESLIRHFFYLLILSGSLLVFNYSKLNIDFKLMKILEYALLLVILSFAFFGLLHWCFSWIWLIQIIFDGQIPNSLQEGYGLYFLLIFLFVAFSFLLTVVCLRRFFTQENDLEVLKPKLKRRKIKMRAGVKGYKRRINPNERGLTFEQKIMKFVNTIRVKRRIKRELKEKSSL